MFKFKVILFLTIILLAFSGLFFYITILRILLVPIVIAFVLGLIAGIYISKNL